MMPLKDSSSSCLRIKGQILKSRNRVSRQVNDNVWYQVIDNIHVPGRLVYDQVYTYVLEQIWDDVNGH
jgi:hypothetical protein